MTDVNHGRAADGDRIADTARAHFDVDGRGEAKPDVDAFADNRLEAGELEGDRVGARRHRRKAIGPGLIGKGDPGGHY